ncbi:hypothetical protein BH18ACT5_BH18ACT5_18100 [soil metagenome]
MKVLITGGTGFIGSALVGRLQQEGHATFILTRPGGKSPTSAASFEWDYQTGPPPAEVWDGVDGVVNLAGEPAQGRWTEAKKARIKQSRVGTTNALIEGMSKLTTRPEVMISASSIGYYGDRGDEILSEEANAGTDFVASVWREAEGAAKAAERIGVNVALTRFGIVLAPDGPAIARLKLVGSLGLLGPIGGGRQWWAWVHRDDVVGFIIHALTNRLVGAFNVVAPDGRRQRDWAATMARVMHRPGFIPAPGFAVRAIIGGFATELLASRHVIPEATQASGYEFTFPDLQPALENVLAED